MRRLTPSEQHAKNAAAILAKRGITQETTQDKVDPEEKEQREVIQATAADLMKLSKSELQEICITKELAFEDAETKAILVEKILASENEEEE